MITLHLPVDSAYVFSPIRFANNEAMRLQCRALFHNFDAIFAVQYIGGQE